MSHPIRALFLTEGLDVPASRFRAEQFLPHLETRGIDCTLRYAYGSAYNHVFQSRLGAPYRIATRLARAAHTLTAPFYDVAFLQRTAIPQTALPEQLAARLGAPLVFDFDDAIYMSTEHGEDPRRAHAFDASIACATEIIAGNDYLAARAGRPERTTVIPTVIDTDVFCDEPFRERAQPEEVVIGWMGTAGNFPAVETIVSPLRAVLEARPQARFVLVSNGDFQGLRDHPRVEQRRWSRETERRDLADFDVGLMPLVDNEWNRGKCGFKMIQYMTTGRPVVASAVGANVDIFEGSGAGALVSTEREWHDALLWLVDDAPARREAGARARQHAVARYSVSAVVDDLAATLRRAAASRRPNGTRS